jgi:hypothetical protein
MLPIGTMGTSFYMQQSQQMDILHAVSRSNISISSWHPGKVNSERPLECWRYTTIQTHWMVSPLLDVGKSGSFAQYKHCLNGIGECWQPISCVA